MKVQRSQSMRVGAAFVVALFAGVLVARCDNQRANTQGGELSSGGSSDAGPVRWPVAQDAAQREDASSIGAEVDAECARDEDCVPSSCCHPTACVAVAARPACEGVMCTGECRGGTFDCGGGSCGCVAGRCAANLTAVAPIAAIDAGVAASSVDASADAGRDAGRRTRR